MPNRRTFPTRWLVALVVIAGLLAPVGVSADEPRTRPPGASTGASCDSEPAGFVAFVPSDDDGTPIAGVAVADPASGEITGEIELPEIERLTQLHAPGMALATTTDGTYLIDIEDGEAERLDIPDDVGTLFEWTQGMPVGTGVMRTVLSNGRDTFLLDFASGEATDLHALLPEDTPPLSLFPVLSPDEEWLLLWDGTGLWLLPAADPDEVRELTPDTISLGGSFSRDSSTIIYGRTPTEGEDRREVVVEPVDGSEPADVIARGTLSSPVFVQGTNLIAFDRILEDADPISAEVVLLDRIAGEESVLYEHVVNPLSIIPSPSGARLMVAINDSEVDFRYLDIDLDSRAVTEFPELDGLTLTGPSGGQWRIAMALDSFNNGNAREPGYYAVNLDEGSVSTLAPITLDTGVFAALPLFNRDGSAAVSVVFGPDEQVFRYFDLAAATATVITENSIAGVGISADGCWVVLSEIPADGEAKDAAVEIIRPGEDDAVSVDLGRSPIWVTE